MKRIFILGVLFLGLIPLACNKTYTVSPLSVTPTPTPTPTNTPAFNDCKPTAMFTPNPSYGNPWSAEIPILGSMEFIDVGVYYSTHTQVQSNIQTAFGPITIGLHVIPQNQSATPLPTGTYVIDVTIINPSAASTICYYDTVGLN